MGPAKNADTRADAELFDAARSGGETALAVLVERHRDRLVRTARLRMDRRSRAASIPPRGLRTPDLAIRGKFHQYSDSADPRPLWCVGGGTRTLAVKLPFARVSRRNAIGLVGQRGFSLDSRQIPVYSYANHTLVS